MTQLSLTDNSLKELSSTTLDTDVPITKIFYNLINFWKGAAAPTVMILLHYYNLVIVTNGINDVCLTRPYNAFTRGFQIILYFQL